MKKQAIPEGRREDDPDTFQIGDLYFNFPYTEV